MISVQNNGLAILASLHSSHEVPYLPAKQLSKKIVTQNISGAATEENDEDEIVTVNFKVTQSFLDEIDGTWQGRGFNSRSEFIRYTLRDAIEFPTFDRDELVALLEAEEDIRQGQTMSAEEARERFGTDGDE